jgi:hypothetical protein
MEESPFEKYQSKTVILYAEPLLDTHNQTYVSALTLNAMPDGPLSKAIRIFNTPNLSPFQTFTNTIQSPNNCTYILMKYPNANKAISTNWMLEEDIPAVFSYLQANNYTIDTSLTKLMNHSQINLGGISQIKRTGNRRMVCMLSFSFPDKL